MAATGFSVPFGAFVRMQKIHSFVPFQVRTTFLTENNDGDPTAVAFWVRGPREISPKGRGVGLV